MSDSFFSLGAQALLKEENRLVKLNQLLDWSQVAKVLKGVNVRDLNGDKRGRPPYEALKMFKAILLGQWHNLSDPELSRCLKLRIDFMLFCGFDLIDNFPDDTTLCRFRNRLIALNKSQILFAEINRQLEQQGLRINTAQGAVIDATLVETAARANKYIDGDIPQDRQEDQSNDDPNVIYCKDKDARWIKKGKQSILGFKAFTSVDSRHGFIQAIHVTPANTYEGNQLAEMIDHVQSTDIYADKGYAQASNRQLLNLYGKKDRIMNKAARGKPLTYWAKLRNKLISKKRYIVEQCFGTLKRLYGMSRASYFGLEKVTGQLHFKSMCYNLQKAINMMPN